MNTLITIVSLLCGIAATLLAILGFNHMGDNPYVMCLNPALAFPAATTLLLIVVFVAMYLDAEERREEAYSDLES